MIALLRPVFGLIVWAVAFSALYGCRALSALGPLSLGRALLILLWLAWLALLSWMSRRYWRGRSDFLGRLAAALALVGLIATAYTCAPVLAGSICR
ncbi:hypothetical protein [Sphingosinithalassobacter sp. CS137]|uniref:hypothetical protein n=1 Tax=Sphingosinithalassobacter sp. CS137 TaxID=2762748 RepID=UPI00165E9DE5|nr:hypothetical protein [Sphingosinithalassobacter sp. CS137]